MEVRVETHHAELLMRNEYDSHIYKEALKRLNQ